MSLTEFSINAPNANKVFVTGSFNSWKSHLPLEKVDQLWTLSVLIEKIGEIDFKFIVDGEWICSNENECRMDSAGNKNNFLVLEQLTAAPTNEISAVKAEEKADLKAISPQKEATVAKVENLVAVAEPVSETDGQIPVIIRNDTLVENFADETPLNSVPSIKVAPMKKKITVMKKVFLSTHHSDL